MLRCASAALALAAPAVAAPGAQAAGSGAAAAARADWSAGAVARGTGYAAREGSQRVREVQRRLTRLGYAPGPVDGLFGPRTQQAATRFQERAGLAADGIVGSRTLGALRARDDARLAARGASPRTTRPLAEPASPAAPEPAPVPAAPQPRGGIGTFLILAGLAGAAVMAAAARAYVAARAAPTGRLDVIDVVPRRELVAQAESDLRPRFTTGAARARRAPGGPRVRGLRSGPNQRWGGSQAYASGLLARARSHPAGEPRPL
jgi:peptidoglycan hydrolase-like protein with peptidoglycan-binding domain